MDLHDIREDYCKQALSQHDCDPNPIKQFEKLAQRSDYRQSKRANRC